MTMITRFSWAFRCQRSWPWLHEYIFSPQRLSLFTAFFTSSWLLSKTNFNCRSHWRLCPGHSRPRIHCQCRPHCRVPHDSQELWQGVHLSQLARILSGQCSVDTQRMKPPQAAPGGGLACCGAVTRTQALQPVFPSSPTPILQPLPCSKLKSWLHGRPTSVTDELN